MTIDIKVGDTFKLNPDTVIAPRSAIQRMGNFRDRVWFVVPDTYSVYEDGCIILVPGNRPRSPMVRTTPLATNDKNAIVLLRATMVKLIEDNVLMPHTFNASSNTESNSPNHDADGNPESL